MKEVNLSVDLIRTDGGTQVRVQESPEAIQRYADALAENRELPRIDVFHDGTDYWLADGHHRLAAFKKRELDTIPCRLHEGDRNAAILFACLANREHGLPLNNQDKRNVVLIYFKIPGSENQSNNAVSKILKLSVPFIKSVREGAGIKPSPSAHVGVGSSKKHLNGLNNPLDLDVGGKDLNGLNNRPEEPEQTPVPVTLPPGNKTEFAAELLRHFSPAYLRSCVDYLDGMLPA